MQKSVSITVPLEPDALNEASRFFGNLADQYAVAGASTLEEFTEAAIESIAKANELPAHLLKGEAAPPAEVETQIDACEAFAAAPPPPPAAQAVAVDSEGLPWDARIHGSGKTKLKGADTWKLKRGVSDELVASVKAELLAAAPPPPAEEKLPPSTIVKGATYKDVLDKVTARVTAGTLEAGEIDKELQAIGVVDLGGLAGHPDKIQPFYDRLVELWGA